MEKVPRVIVGDAMVQPGSLQSKLAEPVPWKLSPGACTYTREPVCELLQSRALLLAEH